MNPEFLVDVRQMDSDEKPSKVAEDDKRLGRCGELDVWVDDYGVWARIQTLCIRPVG